METLSKIFCILLAIVVMFLFPVQYMASKQDSINQVYVYDTTNQLINDIANKGYLSLDMYERYLQKLSTTGNVYEINMTHTHEVINPKYDVDGNAIDGEYLIYDECVYEDDILDEIFEGSGTYYLTRGDYISMELYNTNKTLATRLYHYILHTEESMVQIYVTCGGMIRDENY